MKLVASQELGRHPQDLACLRDGGLLVLTYGDDASICQRYDPQLALVWTIRLERRALALSLAPDGSPWLLDAAGALAIGDAGDCTTRVQARTSDGMQLSAFARVEDGFVFAWEHHHRTPACAALAQRVSDDGKLLWSTALPLEPIAHADAVEASRAQGWKLRPVLPWKPESWFSRSRTLTVSGDAMLACFAESPRSGIGFGYGVALRDGTLRFTTQVGPIGEVASLGGGAFLVGYQGYGVFETLRYERDGRVVERWPSHGLYAIRAGDIRAIELENATPSTMHLVRLLPGGSLTRGAWLDGYYTSLFFQRSDGALVFFRCGELLVADDLSIRERVVLCSEHDRLFSTRVVGDERGVYLAYRSADAGASARLVRVDF